MKSFASDSALVQAFMKHVKITEENETEDTESGMSKYWRNVFKFKNNWCVIFLVTRIAVP